MNWAKKKNANILAPMATVGCGIPSGFGPGEFAKYNTKFFEFVEESQSFEIERTSLSLFDSFDTKNMVNVTVEIEDALDENKTGSVLDSRMGVTEKDRVCGTCCQTSLTCPGHYGYIRLNVSFIHPMYRTETIKLLRSVCHTCGELIASEKVLRGYPHERLDIAEKVGAGKRKCDHCKHVNYIIVNPPTIKEEKWTMKSKEERNMEKREKDKISLIEASLPRMKATSSDEPKTMNVGDIRKILNRVTRKALDSMHFEIDNLEGLIMDNIIVTPLQTRPVATVNGIAENNQMTTMYNLILKVNKDIFPGSENYKNSNWLYLIVNKMLTKGNPYISTLALFKNLKESLSRKAGYFRSSGMGKRIDYASRTVLSPAAETCVGEVSYPSDAAKQMTIPIHVTKYNLYDIRRLWDDGKIMNISPGSTDHPRFGQFLKYKPGMYYKPYIGDICNRYVISGDMVMFNRQPTLDRYSLLAQQALITERNTKVNGINSCATKPANADFDGDEGNMYILQTLESMVEGKFLTNIRKNIISVSTSNPIVSIQYHGVISLYRLTENDLVLDREDWSDAFTMFWSDKQAFLPIWLHGHDSDNRSLYANPKDFFERLRKSGIPKLSGKALFSSLLPRDLHYTNGDVKIRNGILISGPLTKKDVGGGSRGIVHMIYLTHGGEVTADFLSSAQKMADWYLSVNPTSIGLSHLNPINENNKTLSTFIKETTYGPQFTLNEKSDVTDDILSLVHKSYKGYPTNTLADEFIEKYKNELRTEEKKYGLDKEFKYSVSHIVAGAADDIQKQVNELPIRDDMTQFELDDRERKILNIASKTDKLGKDVGLNILGLDNPLVKLYKSGAKGSEGNIAQMTASIGQTSIYGKRQAYTMARTINHPHGSKTLPFFESKEAPDFKETIQSRGYINSSYVRGTDPSHFFFAMAAERIGVITSRVSTADTGYFTRQLIKFCEELHLSNMGDINSAKNKHISFSYFDGFDPTKIVKVSTKQNGDFFAPFDPQVIANQLITDSLS